MRKINHIPENADIARIIREHNKLIDQHNEVKEEIRTLKKNLRDAGSFHKN